MRGEWKTVMLDAIATLRNGAGVKQGYFSEAGVPLARVSNFTHNSIDLSDCKYVDFNHAKTWESHFLNAGDVVVATVGSWPPNWSSVVGKVIRAPETAAGAIQNQNTCCVIPIDGEIDQTFLYFRLKLDDFAWHAANSAGGSANQARLPVKKLGSFEFQLPPIVEQKAISSVLGSLDEKIELNRQINATLESMAQALFKSWFVDFDPVIDNALAAGNPIPEPLQARADKRAALLAAASAADTRSASATDNAHPTQTAPHTQPGTTAPATPLQPLPADLRALFPDSFVLNEEMGWVPEGWSVSCLGEKLKPLKGKNITKKTVQDGGVPVVAGGLEPAYYHNQSNVNGPVVTVSASGANAGFVNIYLEDIWASDCSYISKGQWDFVFTMYLFLKSRQDEITFMQQGAAQPHVYPKDLMRLSLVVPDHKLLVAFESIAESYFHRIRSAENENKVIEGVRDLLLPRLLSGKLRLPEAEKIAAEVL